MINVLAKFLVLFLPTCAIGGGGLWLAENRGGLLCFVGWIVVALFGFAAVLQILLLLRGLSRIDMWRSAADQRVRDLQGRDANLVSQGKSFDEVMSQYKKPKP
jgi:hypothetical protein